jgi:hypothetical protein
LRGRRVADHDWACDAWQIDRREDGIVMAGASAVVVRAIAAAFSGFGVPVRPIARGGAGLLRRTAQSRIAWPVRVRHRHRCYGRQLGRSRGHKSGNALPRR